MEEPVKILTDLINGLHLSIGISTPPPEKVRAATLLWLTSMTVIVIVLAILLRYAF